MLANRMNEAAFLLRDDSRIVYEVDKGIANPEKELELISNQYLSSLDHHSKFTLGTRRKSSIVSH